MKIVLLIACLGLGLSSTAEAVTYSYVGNFFDTFVDDPSAVGTYDSSMRVTATFDIANAFAPNLVDFDFLSLVLNYEFNDGRRTLTDLNSVLFSSTSSDVCRELSRYSTESD